MEALIFKGFRLVRDQKVVGSNPATSTRNPPETVEFFCFYYAAEALKIKGFQKLMGNGVGKSETIFFFFLFCFALVCLALFPSNSLQM